MHKIRATTSVIGIKISCSTIPGADGLDGEESHIWISFRFPYRPPVQIKIPVYGRNDDSKEEGEGGDTTEDAAIRITAALRSEVDNRNISDAEAAGIIVEERKDASGPTDNDHYCRIVLEGVASIDGGSDYGKIRVSGHFGGAVDVGGAVPRTQTGQPRSGWGPGRQPLPYKEPGCPKGRIRDLGTEDVTDQARMKEDSPSAEEQEEEWEEWAASHPGETREYPDGQWRNQTGDIR
jgi:hypothetical protein